MLVFGNFLAFYFIASVLIGNVFSFLHGLSQKLRHFIISNLICYVYACCISLVYFRSVLLLIDQFYYDLCCNLEC